MLLRTSTGRTNVQREPHHISTRCVLKGSFEHLKDKRRGFELSGYLFVVLVDLIIIIACFLTIVLKNFSKAGYARRFAVVNQNPGERTPLLESTEESRNLSRPTIGKNLPILGIIYNKKTVILNCLRQLIIALPILLIYFKPCVSGLQADWVAYLTLGLLGLVNGYGMCAAMMLLAPGLPGKKHEEGLASSIGYMFLQTKILFGVGISTFLVD